MRGSIHYQIETVWRNELDGIGESKAEARETSTMTDLDGDRAVSEKVHSYEYKDEVLRTARDLADYAREDGIKDISRIDGETLREWVQDKIDAGVSAGSLDNYISHLAKFEAGMERLVTEWGQEYQGFTRADLNEAREMIEIQARETGYVDRAYENAAAIVSNLEGKEQIIGELQLEHGLRVSEAANIKESQLNGNELTYQGKGGYEQTKELSPELAQSIRDNMSERGVFTADKNAYRESIKATCEKLGEDYHGTHGLRYNYAQNEYLERYETKIEEGKTHEQADKEALREVSEELGHHREEITDHYLGR